MKKVILWEVKRTEKRKADGSAIHGEYVGKFRTKVDAGTPGAIRHAGTLANGRTYDYTGLDVDSVSGKLRWIDKRDGGDFGTNLVIFLESEKFLHQISIKYDPYNLKDVVNHLCGLGKFVSTQVINLSYWVRKAKTADGSFKVNDKGEPIWNRSISFRDIAPQFNFEQWKDFVQVNGLEWKQIKKANGDKEWISDAEYKYWDSRLLGIQRYLLSEGTALPFMYNSMICCEAPNPSGGGNLTPAEIQHCNEIYERVKADFKFPFGRTETNADSAFDMVDQSEQAARVDFIEQPAKRLPDQVVVDLPTDTTNHEQGPQADDSDLPF